MLLNYRDRGAGFFRSSFYAPSLIGGSVSVAIVWRAMFADDGPVDNSLSASSASTSAAGSATPTWCCPR